VIQFVPMLTQPGPATPPATPPASQPTVPATSQQSGAQQ